MNGVHVQEVSNPKQRHVAQKISTVTAKLVVQILTVTELHVMTTMPAHTPISVAAESVKGRPFRATVTPAPLVPVRAQTSVKSPTKMARHVMTTTPAHTQTGVAMDSAKGRLFRAKVTPV